MPQKLVKRMGRRILDATLLPLIRYGFDPLFAKLESQFEKVAAQSAFQFDQAATKVANQFNQTAAQIDLRSNAAANEQSRRAQTFLRQEIAQLRARIAVDTPANPCVHGFKVYAQTDEDGIIEDILQRLPGHSKTFIEIGCGNGLENNTHYLALQDYRGCWVDGSDDNIAFIKDGLDGLEFKNLLARKNFVTRENIGAIIVELCAFIGTKEPGFFSLDIDGNDLDVLGEALRYFQPLTICTEYNAKFPPPLAIAMRYDPGHRWTGGDYHGASLQAFCDLLVDYKLVASNLSGVNAFFVRRDHAAQFGNYTPRQLYQPFRENLIDLRAEHQPSLKWLRDKLR